MTGIRKLWIFFLAMCRQSKIKEDGNEIRRKRAGIDR